MRAAAERVAFLISESGRLSPARPFGASESRSALAEMMQSRLLSAWAMTWFLVKVSAVVARASLTGRLACSSRSRNEEDFPLSRAAERAW